MYACQAGLIKTSTLLVDRGADVFLKNLDKQNVLHLAMQWAWLNAMGMAMQWAWLNSL